jgi:hypothetical protein
MLMPRVNLLSEIKLCENPLHLTLGVALVRTTQTEQVEVVAEEVHTLGEVENQLCVTHQMFLVGWLKP